MGLVSVKIFVVTDSALAGAIAPIRIKNRVLSKPNTVTTPFRPISLSSGNTLLLKCKGAINDAIHSSVNNPGIASLL